MIRVAPAAEPATFEAFVRTKGRIFLQRTPNPTTKQWQSHNYWREISAELHKAYGGICAYSCHWIPYDTGADTVEHFRPKKLYPDDAYEWSNYRLVCATLNGRKGKFEDVLDPFTVDPGWFVIDFPSMLVKPGKGLSMRVREDVASTIIRLGLNDEGTCLKSRVKWLRDYCKNHIAETYLAEHAPFIYSELIRQDLLATIRTIFIV